jgi:hypothetical protein
MVWLGGPRRPGPYSRKPGGIYLHDPPPGYHPPRPRLPSKDRQRQARQDWVLLHVLTVVLVVTAAAVLVIISLIIAAHS